MGSLTLEDWFQLGRGGLNEFVMRDSRGKSIGMPKGLSKREMSWILFHVIHVEAKKYS